MDLGVFNHVDFEGLSSAYQSAHPFPHIVIDNFLKEEVANQIYESFPSHTASFWHEYNNPLERKLACNVFEYMPSLIREALQLFNSPEVLEKFSLVTGIKELKSDPSLHGGGMHCIRRGGKLDVHVDYALHPKLALERRLNLILYLNKDWQKDWKGDLELWNRDMTQAEKKIAPVFNRAVLFDTGDISFHGHPDPLMCPEDVARKSLAVYYLTDPRPEVTQRYRAKFVARPQDDKSQEIEDFRRLRSGLATGEQLHRVTETKE